jgi:riboflavin kinase/FMN adenylyltransferase
MQCISWNDLVSNKNSIDEALSVSIGVFDGLHRGHRALIDEVLRQSEGLGSAVITFYPHPAQIFSKDDYPGNILSYAQKLELLAATGIEYVILIDFSLDFSKITGNIFINRVFDLLKIKNLVVGYNFHCGNNMDTNADDIARLAAKRDCNVTIKQPVILGDSPVSSTRIRKSITEGKIENARELLSRPYIIDIRKLSTFTTGEYTGIRDTETEQILPKDGSYSVYIDDGKQNVSSAATIKDNALYWNTSGSNKAALLTFNYSLN